LIATGFALLPLVSIIALSSYMSGRLISYKGIKLPLLLGLSVGALGFFGLLITQYAALDYIWFILPLMAMGFGISYCQPAATIAAICALPKERAGLASAIFTTSRQLGSLLGVALFGSIIAIVADFVQGFQLSLIVAGVTYLIGLALACKLRSESELV
jgi:DHA2 family methylenomycin A resistance protein-like MFS transporter